MKEQEFKKLMKEMLGDIWIDGGSLNHPIMNKNKKILKKSIYNKKKRND